MTLEINGKLRKRKGIVAGIGINDADYKVSKREKGKTILCLFYSTWHKMIMRSYNKKSQLKHPTYKNVTVCEEWHSFMNFKVWMETQNWHGKQLDKDIIQPGNKIYDPEFCCFVSSNINLLFTDNKARRGKYPIGVGWDEINKKFIAKCCDGHGKQITLGRYSTVEDAHGAYVTAKLLVIEQIITSQIDERIISGLYLHAERLKKSVLMVRS